MNKKDDNQKNQRIQVFARCRPLNSIEQSKCPTSVVEVIPERKQIVLKDNKDKNCSREFYFDKVFPPDTEQITVYKAVVAPLIQEVLSGYNCTVFAYGQTGTGKTYTMEGELNNSNYSWEDDPAAGVIPRSLHQLFEELNKEETVEFSVRVSYLELYNEEIFDLLSSKELSKLRLYEDNKRKGSVIVQGLEEILVNNKDELYAILKKGAARRQTAATMLNASSSRSHTIFSVTVTMVGEELLKMGKLNLVDLAGSENVGRSGSIEKRAREAGNINQSLLTLGRVITALVDKKKPHVPYRESKLTRLLQDSLDGHTMTSIIATISPAQCNYDETMSTLDYSNKAKHISIDPEANQKTTEKALIKSFNEKVEDLNETIECLQKELDASRGSQGYFVDSDLHKFLLTDNSTMAKKIKELVEENKVLQEKTKLLQVADQATDDLSKLHTKLNQKQIVEKANEEQCNKFRMISQKKSVELYDMIIEDSKDKLKFLQVLKEDQDGLQDGLCRYRQKTTSLHDTLNNELKSLLNSFSAHLNMEGSNERQLANDLSQDMNSEKISKRKSTNHFLLLIQLGLDLDKSRRPFY